MNKSIKCIIIDLYVTLIDSGPDLMDALNFVLKKQAVQEISDQVIGTLVGGGAKSMIEKAYNHLKLRIPEKKIDFMINDFLDFYFDNCYKKSRLYPNVEKTLKVLKPLFKLAVCTNKKQHITNKILEKYNIKQYFDYVLGSGTEFKLKPDIAMLEHCSEKLAVQTKNCMMVGDSNNDIIPANILSMKSVYVSYGYGKLIDQIIPDFKIDKFDDLIKILI